MEHGEGAKLLNNLILFLFDKYDGAEMSQSNVGFAWNVTQTQTEWELCNNIATTEDW